MNIDLSNILAKIPHKTGVYKYYNHLGEILYVGKAKNLHKRVQSYFRQDNSPRIQFMVSQIHKIEYVLVQNERESLLLEASLISNLQPKYNVLLRNPKNYTYIQLSQSQIPQFFITNKPNLNLKQTFGPFDNKQEAEKILNSLKYCIHLCDHKKISQKACKYYHIKQCSGVCLGKESLQDYQKKLDQAISVLKGRPEELQQELILKMKDFSSKENFEMAFIYKQRFLALEKLFNQQDVILNQKIDLTLITLVIKETREEDFLGSFFVQNIRGGRVVNTNNFLLSGFSELKEKQDLVEFFVKRFFESISNLEIIFDLNEKSKIFLETFLVKD